MDDPKNPEAAAASPSLMSRIARGAGWIVGGRFIMGLLGFLNTIIVARLLVPEDFGVVAIGLTAMQILTNLSDIGVNQAVIRFRDAGRADLDTLFTLSAIRGVLIALLLAAAAPFAARFYGDPRVFWVFVGVGAYPLLTGFVNPRFFEFERALDYSKEFVNTVINKFAGVIVSVAIAFAFRNYWAIVLGLATSGLVQLVLSYLMKPYRPSLTLKSFRRMMGFSGWLTGVGLMSALNNKLDPLVLARVIGAEGAGHYFMGLQLAELPTRELAFPVSRALYPGLSELQEDPERANAAFLKGAEALAAVAAAAALGFALVAHDLVPMLLGEKWLDAVDVVEIITPVMGLQMPLIATQYYAMALGSTRLVFLRELIFFLIRTPIFIWASIEYGLIGAAWAVAGCGLVHVALNLALYAKTSARPFYEPLWRIRRSVLAALAMTAALVAMRVTDIGVGWPPLLKVTFEVIAGGAVYVGAHALFWRLEGYPDGVERAVLALAAPVRRALSRR